MILAKEISKRITDSYNDFDQIIERFLVPKFMQHCGHHLIVVPVEDMRFEFNTVCLAKVKQQLKERGFSLEIHEDGLQDGLQISIN